jgi:hypothetical protein
MKIKDIKIFPVITFYSLNEIDRIDSIKVQQKQKQKNATHDII